MANSAFSIVCFLPLTPIKILYNSLSLADIPMFLFRGRIKQACMPPAGR